MPNTITGPLRLTFDGKTYFHETSAQISFSTNFKERTTKDTEGTEVAPDILSYTASGEGLHLTEVEDGTANLMFEDLFDFYLAKTEIDIEFTPNVQGQTKYMGKAFIETLDINSGTNEDPTASFSLRGNGVPAKAVIPAP